MLRASDVSFHTFSHPWIRHILQRIVRTISALLILGTLMFLANFFIVRDMLHQGEQLSTSDFLKSLTRMFLMPALIMMTMLGASLLVGFSQGLRTLRVLPFSTKTLFAGILAAYLAISAVGMMPVCWALWVDGALSNRLLLLVAIFPVVAGIQLLAGCTFPRWGYQTWLLSMGGAAGLLVGGLSATMELKSRFVFSGLIQCAIFCAGLLLLAAGAAWLYSLLRNSSAAYQTRAIPFANAATPR